MDKFIITNRNKNNSEFQYVFLEKFKRTEAEIISDIKNVGHEFYTLNPTTGELIPVTVANGHIKSVANDTTEDNIGNLPLI